MIPGTEAKTKADAVKRMSYGSDPHAEQDHVERRNPVTSLVGSTEATSILAKAGLDPADPRVALLADLVDGLHQLPRHRSIHVGGFVLTREPLSRVVPIEPASMPDRTVIQWEKDDLDPVGLVKIDLLGLGMLTLLQDCLLYINAHARRVARPRHHPGGRPGGVRRPLPRRHRRPLPGGEPRADEHAAAHEAARVLRPRGRGGAHPARPHPGRHGASRSCAGARDSRRSPTRIPRSSRCSSAPSACRSSRSRACRWPSPPPASPRREADELRRAMGHKRSHERMARDRRAAGGGHGAERHRRRHRRGGSTSRSTPSPTTGFPRATPRASRCWCTRSAWLRHYYPPEYTAAILNAQPMGFYSPGTLVEDARRHGVEVRPVDVTESRGIRHWSPLRPERSEDRVASDRHTMRPDPRLRLRTTRTAGRAPRVPLHPRTRHRCAREARARLAERPFSSVADVVHPHRPRSRRAARPGGRGCARRFVAHESPERRRRMALWEVLRAEQGGPARCRRGAAGHGRAARPSCLAMSPYELTEADYRMTALSLNGHPMAHLRTRTAEARRAHGHRAAARCATEHGGRRRPRHLPPASRHRQGVRLPHARGRDRHGERV